jgi:hypothetical protein
MCSRPVPRVTYAGNRWVIAELADDPDAMAGLARQGLREPSDPVCDRCLF